MQLGIVRPEMKCEPCVQSSRQAGRVELFTMFKSIHDVAQLIEQSLMILFVRPKSAACMVAHELFFEGEVSGYSLEQIAEKGGNALLGIASTKLLLQLIDQLYELLVLVVDRLNADAVFVLPVE
ncbi:MAG TPA: hypothetical protein VGQ54_00890 [Burkholderiales bacterium]|nr:hypothetical protein [Burkholderiales bacterium]